MLKSVLLLLLLSATLLPAQLTLQPHIGLNAPPKATDAICPIPVYQGNMYSSGYFEGDTVPDFTLYQSNGDSVRLRDLLLSGKPVLLVGGNYTCPVFRGKINALNAMTDFYKGQLQVYVVYTVEAHPVVDVSPYSGQVWTTSTNVTEGVLYEQPDTYGERLVIVDSLRAHYKIAPEILVDGPCNEWWSHFGPAPNNAYLIGTDGVVKAKHGWFHRAPDNMWCDVDSLLGTISGQCLNVGNQGAFSVTLDDPSHIAQGQPGEVLAIHSTIKNLSATDNVEVRLTKQNVQIPPDWATALCADICYATTVNSTDITIGPGELQPFIFYFYSGTEPDTGRARVRFTNLNNAGNQFVQPFIGITTAATSVSNPTQSTLRVFPNPTTEWLTVQHADVLPGTACRLTDLLGKTVLSVTLEDRATAFSVAALPPGVYFLQTTGNPRATAVVLKH